MSHRLFGSAFCTWILIICFLAACSAPPVNQSPVKVLPADPNAAVYNTKAIDEPISDASVALLKELKPHPLAHITKNSEYVSRTSNFDWYRKNHKTPLAPNFQQDLFTLKADSNPGKCIQGFEGDNISTMKYTAYSYKYNVNNPTGSAADNPLSLLWQVRFGATQKNLSLSFYQPIGANYSGPFIDFNNIEFPTLKVGGSYTADLTEENTGIHIRAGNKLVSGSISVDVTENELKVQANGVSDIACWYYLGSGCLDYEKIEFGGGGTIPITTGTCAPIISLIVDQNLLKQGTDDVANFTITPEDTTLPWVLAIEGPEGTNQSYSGTGDSVNEYKLLADLPAGDYIATAYYSEHPEYKATALVKIRPEIKMEINPTLIKPSGNERAQITVNPSSNQDKWTFTILDPEGHIYRQEITRVGLLLTNLGGAELAEGIYTVKAAYNKFPEVSADDQVKVENRPNINVTGNPSSLIIGDGKTAAFDVVPEDTSLPWEMQIVDPEPNSSTETVSGTGVQSHSLPTPLKKGTYQAVVFYKKYPYAGTLGTVNVVGLAPTPSPTQTPDPNDTPEPTPDPNVTPTPDPVVTPTPDPVVTPTPDPNVTPTPDPNVTPTPDPNVTPTPGPTPTPTPPPTPTPTPSDEEEGCGYGEIEVEVEGGKICVYCPPDYFDYSEALGCHTRLDLTVEHTDGAGPIEKGSKNQDVAVFSPRDLNGSFDTLQFRVKRGEHDGVVAKAGADFVKWKLALDYKVPPANGGYPLNGPRVLWQKADQGAFEYPFTAWESGVCLKDNRYLLKAEIEVDAQANGRAIQAVKVPDFTKPVPVMVLWNQQSETDGKTEQEFWIDNTPPVVVDFISPETKLSAPSVKPEVWRTDVSLEINEPAVNSSFTRLMHLLDSGGVPTGLRAGDVKVYVDDVLYAQPSDFGVLNQAPLWDHVSISNPSKRKATVSFSLPYRLPGHRIMVAVSDANFNSAYYLVYPKGGF